MCQSCLEIWRLILLWITARPMLVILWSFTITKILYDTKHGMAYWFIAGRHQSSPCINGVCICLRAAPHCRGSVSAFVTVKELRWLLPQDLLIGFFSIHILTCIQESYSIWEVERDRKQEGKQESQNKALQEAVITMRKKRINCHLQCISGC